jgi:uncharacterized protein (TIGR02722 family)
MKSFAPLVPFLSLSCAAVILAGCSTPPTVHYVDPNGQGAVAGTGIESQDVNAAAAQAAQSIVNLPEIANASQPPVVMIAEPVNRSSSPIDKTLLTNTLRDALLNGSGGKVRFIDRSTMAVNQKEQQMVDSGEVQQASQGGRSAMSYDYLLTAEIQGIGMNSSQGQSDYFRMTFKLINRKTDLLIWTNPYQIKKEGVESAVYR